MQWKKYAREVKETRENHIGEEVKQGRKKWRKIEKRHDETKLTGGKEKRKKGNKSDLQNKNTINMNK